MNCAFDKEKLSGYYDGELDAAEKAEVERHIASCSECLRELGELKSSALLVKELPRLRAPRSIAEGIAREIQTAGKVHHFAQVRRNVLWACAAAAGIFVVLNVAYFVRMERSAGDAPAVAAKPAPTSIASVPPPADAAPLAGVKQEEEKLRRSVADRAVREEELGTAAKKRKNSLDEAKRALDLPKAEQPAAKAEPERAANEPKPTVARAAEPKPAEAPAAAPPAPPAPAKPAAPAPTAKPFGGKEDAARPAEPPVEKGAAAKLESLPKDSDMRGKRAADAQVEAAATHYTLASTQMIKARTKLEETLRQMGAKIPAAPAASIKGQTGKSFRDESTFSLELTESQLSRLRQELENLGHSRLVLASPGDAVLKEFGDTGLYRATRKDVASGGAAPVKKAVEAPKADAPKPAAAEAKEAEKDGKEGQQAFKVTLEGAGDKAAEPKRKIILHLLDVPFMPEQQPAPDPVKK
jgi:hypothetical protein